MPLTLLEREESIYVFLSTPILPSLNLQANSIFKNQANLALFIWGKTNELCVVNVLDGRPCCTGFKLVCEARKKIQEALSGRPVSLPAYPMFWIFYRTITRLMLISEYCLSPWTFACEILLANANITLWILHPETSLTNAYLTLKIELSYFAREACYTRANVMLHRVI